ncbi:Rhodanese-like domain-containing protein [Lineolata rhizophorae]|uniref:Rhodanese-like domain-containing protein n=1 Tax=Lineolata rhizophorae TaxID=578093 RepID=A0A6A6NWF2_9PEZI|nr:Rhodanese-like domain-containing protein [Lineolata rhizophorae]
MAARRALFRLPLRASSSAALRNGAAASRYASSLASAGAQPKWAATAVLPAQWRLLGKRAGGQTRWYSSELGVAKEYKFDDVKQLSEKPDENVQLIDVREPQEYANGHIPTALNIPVTTQPDALFLSPEEFEDRFGFAKPATDKGVIFYCKAGVRSATMAQLAINAGYKDVGEYKGSYMDWEKNGGKAEKP